MADQLYCSREERLSQGDILEDVPFRHLDGREVVMRGMVVSHDCEIDKFFEQAKKLPAQPPFAVLVAPVRQADTLPEGDRGNIMSGKVRRWFPLPASGDLPDMAVPLNMEQPLDMRDLLRKARVASLVDEWVERYHIALIAFRTRRDLGSL